MSNLEDDRNMIIGSILVYGRQALARAVQSGMRADDFKDWRHRIIYLAAKDISGPIDVVTMSDHLSRVGLLEVAGGPEYLHKLTAENIPVTEQCESCHGELRPQYYCPECGAYNPEEEN